MLRSIVLTLMVAVVAIAHARQQTLTARELADLERISRPLLGAPATEITRTGRQLATYARSASDVDHWTVLCTGQYCYATMHLRADSTINFIYLHVPSARDARGQHDLRPDIVVRGNNRIVQVTVVRHGSVLFALGKTFKRTASNRSLQPTAGRSEN
jgi:hypothetical protein